MLQKTGTRQTNKQGQQLNPTLSWFSVWFYLIFLGKYSLFHLMDRVLLSISVNVWNTKGCTLYTQRRRISWQQHRTEA